MLPEHLDLEDDSMEWAEPTYSRTRVDAAGRTLLANDVSDDELDEALTVINNWRSSHSYPLNTFQMGLRQKIQHLVPPWIVAQRIKRLPAIALKLHLSKSMKLSQMQDIGGCRAVVQGVSHVNELVSIYQSSRMKHELIRPTDYIKDPRATGYRSVHLIYRYHGEKEKESYSGLRIEMQLRSRLQHAWATAVETIGDFVGEALKSNLGSVAWRRFFFLMASAIANEENSPPPPNAPPNHKELIGELRDSARALNVERTLQAFGKIAETRIGTKGADFFLVATNPTGKSVEITGFARRESEKAMEQYAEVEKSFKGIPGAQVVLVSVDSLAKLRRAYPSYFLESRVFLSAMKRAIRR
jgi:ppGpp synthetase/RelA/SpoT-type nucleotidyltranferase